MKSFTGVARIGKRHRPLRSALVGLYQHHQLTHHFAEIPTVDLINDEDVRSCQIAPGPRSELVERSISKHKPAAGRTIALNEIFVGVRLVKLHHFDSLRS